MRGERRDRAKAESRLKSFNSNRSPGMNDLSGLVINAPTAGLPVNHGKQKTSEHEEMLAPNDALI